MSNTKTSYNSPADHWVKAQPLGNGSIGAMVFGGVKSEKISLNHDTMWSGRPRKIDFEGKHEQFLKARELTFAGRYAEATEIIEKHCLIGGVESYMAFGDMDIDFNLPEDEVTDYSRVLDMENAVHTTSFRCGGISYKRECLVSYPDDVLMMKITSDGKKAVSLTIHLSSELRSHTYSKGDTLYLKGELPEERFDFYTREEEIKYFDEPEKRGVQFLGGASVITDGKVLAADDFLSVENADEVTIVFSIKTSYNGFDKHPYLEGREYENALEIVIDSAKSKGYDAIKNDHIADYKRFFEIIELDLGVSGREDMPTDERLLKFAEDKDDISLPVLLFNFGRYLTIAASREGTRAMNLQGIWNNSITPPWRCDYTTNINTEMNYWPTLMCGLDSCYMPLIELIKEISINGEVTAKGLYNARGFISHHNVDAWGYTAPVLPRGMWCFWNGSAGWLCRHLFEYYEYTLDRDFLKSTAYPIMKKAAMCYLDLLCDRGDGFKSVCATTSPENTFYCVEDGEKKEASVAKYATMTDTIAYELFLNCRKAMDILGADDKEFGAEIDDAISSMKPFSIGSDGRLMEWNEEFEEPEPDHRHISHLYGLHPANLITPDKTPDLAEACVKTLKVRGDQGTGWSLGWKINFYARLKNGNRALDLLEMQLNAVDENAVLGQSGTYPNLFDAHPPFQIDGNFALVSGIIEMIVKSQDDELEFLPALPDKWKNGSLKGVRVKGNKIYDIKWADGKLVYAKER